MSKGDWETAGAPNGRTAAGRLDWVDAVKGLTIILVVLHHAVAGFRFDPNLPVWVADLTRALDPVRMPLFFLVAGLFAKKALDGPADAFIRGKVVYFLYFYVLWSLIIFLFRFSLNPITNSVTYWWEIFLILWDPLPTIWFLYALMLSFVILRLLRSVPPVYIVGVAAIIQAQFLLGVWPEGVVIADKLAKLFVYFVIGVYASEWIRSRASTARPLVVALCAAGFGVLAVLAASWDLQKIPIVFFSLSALSAAAIIGAIVLVSNAGRAHWLVVVGSYSLYIYLTHFLPVAGTRIILTKIVGVTEPLLVIPICVIVAVVFGIAFCRILTGTRFEWLIRLPKWLSERRYDIPMVRSPSA
ncbi:acyltransferase family protein [Ruegeria sp. R14_0]|uniref:acyltransferase family protein n=1 Tax=Ruegeria sp. R14_0 TaxID=2821100 RepID=UPI001ADBDA55|nr:acyltransferase family protein [Ruegeria sp. R14_0]MBO9447286.1 acyltransferase family protein [Ruegeria sp. R14_0]